jgi:RNA polymerase sigma factor (sigma-70 family)
MSLSKRQDIVEIFSTFVKFEATQYSQWVTDGSLDRNMRRTVSQAPLRQESQQWAIHWYKEWQSQQKSLARSHLYAYLQEPCYKAALKINERFTVSKYSIPEYFQLAVMCTDKVLQGFNPDRSSNFEVYALIKFQNLIKDGLVKEGLPDACIRGDWSLLQNCSEKLLRKSLQQAGTDLNSIENYILVWQCFKTIYIPSQPKGNNHLNAPDAANWQAIAELYHQTYQPQTTCNPDTANKWMCNCIKAVRDYMAPAVSSLNTPISEEGNTLEENLQSQAPTPFEQILDNEQTELRRRLTSQINDILTQGITNLDAELQNILAMYYGEGLTQTEIAKKLEMSQASISRRLAKINKFKTQSLCSIAEWSQKTLNNSITPDVLENVSALIDEWLEHHYTQTLIL